MTRPRPTTAARLRASLAALLLGLLGAVALGPVAAQAHGGPITIELGTDGGGGVDAFLTYVNDGHPVEESAAITVVAVSDAGEEVGPLTLQSATSGVGWYRSDAGVLGEGHWTVTATVTEPSEVEATVELDIVAPPVPEAAPESAPSEAAPEVEAGGESDGAAETAAEGTTEVGDAASDTTASAGFPWLVVGGVVLVALGATIAVVLSRRKRAARA
ncbi:hypothetical protein C8046_11905 [Serinibacter arcticus]|uniref:Uncharacterized protein n=1 Tax=Serinibacter arcticus TaxID=1655435 RepID=A0A2U1ZWD8_9MICO|nr:hypothetical protein [Serinibacter arcticus]PWD51253.1 hypothetical protein C8046_11905 [Serinibacter arcticus]